VSVEIRYVEFGGVMSDLGTDCFNGMKNRVRAEYQELVGVVAWPDWKIYGLPMHMCIAIQ